MNAQAIFERWLRPPPPPITTDRVIEAVAAHYGLRPADLCGHRRHRSLAWPRAVAMYLLRTRGLQSLAEIARDFDRRHHTTVIAAVRKVAARLERGGVLADDLRAIEGALGVVS